MIRYEEGIVDCCEVKITFFDAAGNSFGDLWSHNVPEDSVVSGYKKTSHKVETEVLSDTEMVVGVKINQDHQGANTSMQFMITESDPAKRVKGGCCN